MVHHKEESVHVFFVGCVSGNSCGRVNTPKTASLSDVPS